MPTIDFVDIGDVLNYEFLQGTLKTINPDDDTCTVEVSGRTYNAILFYHWEPGSPEVCVLRENGAIRNSWCAFISSAFNYYHRIPVTTTVLVMKKKDDSVVRVLGFVNTIRTPMVLNGPTPPLQY